jgi:hypothetical protein
MADNQQAIVNGGATPDWIELYNAGATARDLGGMSVSDDPANPRKYVFPSGTILVSHYYLVVWCDSDTNAPGLHTGFGLSASGQQVALYSADVLPAKVDSVQFGLQVPDLSIGRVPNGTGPWQLTSPTPWQTNAAQSLGSATQLRINEWLARATSGSDWFELFNTSTLPVALGGLSLTDDPATPGLSPVPALSYIAPRAFQLFWADGKPDKGADHANFKLSVDGENIGLYAGTTRLDLVFFGSQTTDMSQGRLPDGAATFVFFNQTQSPGDSNYLPLTNVVVNEVLAHTDPPLEDAVEFLNLTAAPIDLSGWYLSNRKGSPLKCRLPPGTVLPANGYAVIYEYQFNRGTADPNSFTLNSAHGDEVVLSEAKAGSLTGYRVSQKFGATANGVSMSRILTSSGADFIAAARPTFGVDSPSTLAAFRTGKGAANAGPLVGPVIINEIMYHPPDIITSISTNDDTLNEYLELYNPTTSPVPLFDPLNPGSTWRITNAVEFTFAPGTAVAAQGYLLVVSFNPKTDTNTLDAFRAKHAVPLSVPITGPWDGKLANGGETIDLLRPDAPQAPPHPDAGFVPYVRVEKVKYSNTAPWPTPADGTGPSLQRLDPVAYGNDHVNWYADAPSPGRANGHIEINSAGTANNNLVLSFVALPGRAYTVQAREAVADGTWTNLAKFAAASGAVTREFSDPLRGPGGQRYYRLVSPAGP